MSDQETNSGVELTPVKRALLEIRELRERLRKVEGRAAAPIAIVGIGCRFPGGVVDADSFWELLEQGRDAITEMPRDRFDVDGLYDPDPDAAGKMSTRWGGFVDGVERFDSEFFGISAREARSLDPQQRLLLEVAWEALEDAGIDPSALQGSATGVFAGIAAFDYPQLELQTGNPADIDAYFATGAAHSVAAGRLSYVLGLKGPCMAVDTSCSASLVGVHLACQSLRSGECDLALAGGASILLLPEMFVDFSSAHMMAADGRCKTFDAAADGYVRGEGCGIVVLKRLDDALAAGDRVLAIVRGSAINHDGRSGGLTAPNGPSQVAVIEAALERAGLRAADVGYVEAHGTGTSLGDPIEVQALGAALCAERSADRPLLIGSVKTNIGHLEAAAGIAGLIKAALAVQRGVIPGSLHFRKPNPAVAWERLAVRVVTDAMPWPSLPSRIAGVSSFGFSGTNAHILIEGPSAPSDAAASADRPLHVMTVSGRTPAALAANAARLAAALEVARCDVADFAYSKNVGRAHFAYRAAIVGADRSALAASLARFGREGGDAAVRSGEWPVSTPPRICLVFGGQGSQYADMGRVLAATQPTFRDALQRCDSILAPLLGRSLDAVLFSAESATLLADVRFAQPAVVAFQYALATLWREWGVVASAALGHSLGEYSAAMAAGVLSLEDGLRLVAERAELIASRCVPGGMVALRADVDRARQLAATVGATLDIAAHNGTDSVVVSGAAGEIDAFVVLLRERDIRHQVLDSTRAFHNALLEPALGEFARRAARVEHRAPTLQLFSNLQGNAFGAGRGPDATYWAEQARHRVRFIDTVHAARDAGIDVFIEVGPGATLTSLVQEACAADAALAARCFTSLRRGTDDSVQLLDTVAALYVAGVPIDWRAFDKHWPRRRVTVPGYAFQRARHWYVEAEKPLATPSIDWQRCVAAGDRQAAQVPIELDVSSYAARWDLLDELTTAHIVRALRELGLFVRSDERHGIEDSVHRLGILPMYTALLERWLGRLVAKGLLIGAGKSFGNRAPLCEPDLAPLLERCRRTFADAPYLIDYLQRCGAGLAAIVTGKESALETLFPGGSLQTAVDLYRNWAVSRYFNGIAAALVGAVERELHPGDTLRVLEIGGGTGGTTAAVLPAVSSQRTRYCFTDVSEFFFAAAAEDFASYPFVEYAVLDMERDPDAQGFGRHAFHAVVAANVLHATRDLAATVDRVLSLLQPGGLLILYEVTAPKPWLDTSVALIAGWAESTDGLRDDGPLLAAATWRSLLLSRGFVDVAIFPSADSPASILGMSVIAARAPAAAVEAVVPQAPGVTAPRGDTPPVSALQESFATALPNERRDLLVDVVREHVAAVLRRDPALGAIGRRQSLMDLGLDSLMAVELRNRLTRGLALDRTLPVSLIFDYPHIEAIADYLVDILAANEAPVVAADMPVPSAAHAVADISALSDDAIEALLLKKLDGGGRD